MPATMSMSATSSLWRRIEPATSAARYVGMLLDVGENQVRLDRRARGIAADARSAGRISIPLRIFSAVFLPELRAAPRAARSARLARALRRFDAELRRE